MKFYKLLSFQIESFLTFDTDFINPFNYLKLENLKLLLLRKNDSDLHNHSIDQYVLESSILDWDEIFKYRKK